MTNGGNAQPEKRLLIVDDSEEDIFFLLRGFKAAGFTPHYLWLQNGGEALKHVNQAASSLRLILCDIKMPLCSGLEFLAAFRARPEFNSIPVVMWSSSSHESDLQRAQTMGAAHYLLKPSELKGFREIALSIQQIWLADPSVPFLLQPSSTDRR